MADLRGLVGEMASALAGTDIAVLQGRYQPRGGSSLHTFDAAGRSAFADTGFAMHDLLRRVDEVLRPDGEDRPLVVELARDGAGRAELRYTFDLPAVAPVRLVLDPAYRHPNHPASPMPAPPGIAVTDRPTDPEVLATIRGLVAEFVSENTRKTGRTPEFGAGHSEEDIRAAEAAMGLRLPEDLRALYRTVSGDEEYGLLGAGALLPLDSVVAAYLAGRPGAGFGPDDLFAVFPVVYEAYPPGRVRRVSRNDWWVEVGTDWGGNYCMVDLDPGPKGTCGQIIQYGRDFYGPVGYVAESVTAALHDVLAALRDDGTPGAPRPIRSTATPSRWGSGGSPTSSPGSTYRSSTSTKGLPSIWRNSRRSAACAASRSTVRQRSQRPCRPACRSSGCRSTPPRSTFRHWAGIRPCGD